MARKCDECSKKAVSGHNVSHSKRRTRRLFRPNLHFVTMMVRGVSQRLRLCTQCIKTFKKKNLALLQTKTPVLATA